MNIDCFFQNWVLILFIFFSIFCLHVSCFSFFVFFILFCSFFLHFLASWFDCWKAQITTRNECNWFHQVSFLHFLNIFWFCSNRKNFFHSYFFFSCCAAIILLSPNLWATHLQCHSPPQPRQCVCSSARLSFYVLVLLSLEEGLRLDLDSPRHRIIDTCDCDCDCHHDSFEFDHSNLVFPRFETSENRFSFICRCSSFFFS